MPLDVSELQARGTDADGTEPLLGTIVLQAGRVEVDARSESLGKRRRFRL